MKEAKIEIPDGKMAKWVNGVLTLVDEKPQNVMERIKTFEDALNELRDRAKHGDEDAEVLVNEYDNVYSICIKCSKDLLAYLKLRIITYALNEGWEPKFEKTELRYYPWFKLKTSHGGNNTYAVCGLSYAGELHASSLSSHGCQLAFKSKELAEYAGKQFIDIYVDYLFNPNERHRNCSIKK